MRKSAWLRRDASGIDEIHMHEFADNAAFSREYGDCLDEEDGATQPLVVSPPDSPVLHSLNSDSPHLIPPVHQHWSWES